MTRYSGFLLLFLIVFLTSSCKRNFQYSVLEVRPLAKNLNAKALEKIRQLPQKDTFSFLVISDTQIAYDELQRFVKHANKLEDQDQVAFVLHGGDFTDYGANFEYNLYYDDIKKLKFPVVGVIGNHDMLGNGREIYGQMFGPENFSFVYGKNKFIFFNSNSREVAFDGSIPDLGWIEKEIASTSTDIENLFFISHVAPMTYDFDQTKTEDLARLLSSHAKARLSIHGHTHSYRLEKPFEDQFPYLTVPTLQKQSYVKVTVQGQKITHQQINY